MITTGDVGVKFTGVVPVNNVRRKLSKTNAANQ